MISDGRSRDLWEFLNNITTSGILTATDGKHLNLFGFQVSLVMVAILAALLFCLPCIGVLNWKETKIPWDLMVFSAGAGVLDEAYRREHGVCAAGEKIVFKVHMDDDDIVAMWEMTGAKKAVLFHSDEIMTRNVKERLAQMGVEGLTIACPQKAEG